MAQITSAAIPQYTIPKTKTSRQARSIVFDFTPTSFSANVTNGDNILLVTLPKDARIISAGVRVAGAVGTANAYVQLQATENSVTTPLTEPMGVSYANAAIQIVASPFVDPTKVKTLELLVGGGSIDRTVTNAIEITLHHDFLRLAG